MARAAPSGSITYMRTDSVQVSSDSQREARSLVKRKFGGGFPPKTPPRYKTRSKAAQEAHEAIPPDQRYARARIARALPGQGAACDLQADLATLCRQPDVASRLRHTAH